MSVEILPLETLSDKHPHIVSDLGVPAPHLFRIFDCNRPLMPSMRHCLVDLESVVIGRGELRCDGHARKTRQLCLWLADPWMSSHHAQLTQSDGHWVVEDTGSRNGTLVNGARVSRAVLDDGDLFELGRTFFVFRTALQRSLDEPNDLESSSLSPVASELASLSPSLAHQLRLLVSVCASAVTIVVQGETGTGKERIARAVHALSHRPGHLIAVNCGALPETLIEAELFGCRRGAFTGAQDRPGLVRAADRGTLFLDEIGDLPLAAQVALLRVLQEREVLAVGATQPLPVDFRVVCATQQPLEALVRSGRFRSDLFARLAGFTVRLPALRERREDLGIIMATLIRHLAPDRSATISFDKDAARALLLHPFLLNIRELEKSLERAIALAGPGPIQLAHLSLDTPARTAHATVVPSPDALDPGDASLHQRLVALLDLHRGNVSAIARAMGKERVQIRRWLRRWQIDPGQFRR